MFDDKDSGSMALATIAIPVILIIVLVIVTSDFSAETKESPISVTEESLDE